MSHSPEEKIKLGLSAIRSAEVGKRYTTLFNIATSLFSLAPQFISPEKLSQALFQASSLPKSEKKAIINFAQKNMGIAKLSTSLV